MLPISLVGTLVSAQGQFGIFKIIQLPLRIPDLSYVVFAKAGELRDLFGRSICLAQLTHLFHAKSVNKGDRFRQFAHLI